MKVITKFQSDASDEARASISEAIDKIVAQGVRFNKSELKRVTWISEAIAGRNFEGLKSFTVKN